MPRGLSHRKRFPILMMCLLGTIIPISCHQGVGERATRNTIPVSDSLTLILTGDVLLSRGVDHPIKNRGLEWIFEGVAPVFRRADATIINLECPLTDLETPLGKRFIFRADTRLAKELRKVGITHAALANNHTNDQGYQGFESTVSCLREAGITPLGTTRVGKSPEPVVISKEISRTEQRDKGTTHISSTLSVALFNAVLFPLENWMPQDTSRLIPWQTNIVTLCEAVRQYKTQHPDHHIVCILHWGVEYQSTPSPLQRRQARMLAQAGTEAIIGHHPHVVQPLRYEQVTETEQVTGYELMKLTERSVHPGKSLRRIPVAYSLGNFVFDNQHPEACQAQMAELILRPDTLYLRMHDIHIEHCRPL